MKHNKILILICIVALTLAIFAATAQAFHSFDVNEVRTCLDGAIFDGVPTAASALDLSMVGQVFDISATLVASGNSHTFTAIGQTRRFRVTYPVGTFTVGETIQISASDIPGTQNGAQGDFENATVANCLLPTSSSVAVDAPCDIGDGRLNNRDCGAPVAVYLSSIDVFGIDPSSGHGNLDVRISDEQIDALGVPAQNMVLAEGVNAFTGQPITIWRLSTGEFQLNTTYADGKAYIITWEAGGTNLTHLAA